MNNYQEFKDNRATIVSKISSRDTQRVDLKTGYLSIEHKDIATAGAILPASVSHIFVSVNNNTQNTYNCGNGWRLSAHQSVETSDDNTYHCIYTDALGKKHYFDKATKKDIDGLNLTFEGTLDEECYIKDRGGNTMTFNADGKLIKLSDKNENKVTYTYTGGLLTAITDSFNKSLTLTYENGYLSKITDPKGREVKYTYNEQGQLTEIEDPDTLKTTYSYDRNRIYTIDTPTGVLWLYLYAPDSNKLWWIDKFMTLSKVSKTECVRRSVPCSDEAEIFFYADDVTAITDKYGTKQVYVLDEDGRCIRQYQETDKTFDEFTKEALTGSLNGYSNYGYKDGKRVFYSSLTADQDSRVSQNLITNGDFNNNLNGWTKVDDTSNDYVVDTAFVDSTKSFKFTPSDDASVSRSLIQRVKVSNLPENEVPGDSVKIKHGNTLTLSAWGKTSSITNEGSVSSFKLRAVVGYAEKDENGNEIIVEDEAVEAIFARTTQWQYNSLPIHIDMNKTVKYVDVYLNAEGISDFYFNDIHLENTLSDNVEYEEDLNESVTIFGEEKTVKQRVTEDNGIVKTITENDENYRPLRVKVKYIDSDEFVSVFKYDEKSNLIASQDYHGNVTLNEYNSKGNVTRTRAYHSDSFNTAASLTCPVKCFVKEYTYDNNGEYMEEESDQRSEDITTQYNYDKDAGLLNYDIDNKGQKTSYTYDQNTHAPTSVSALLGTQDNRVDYSYNKRFLTAITHNGFDYLFEYDGFGRRTKVTAGDSVLSTTEYISPDSFSAYADVDKVQTTYGNGEKYLVTCDKQRRPVKKEDVTTSTPVTVWEKKYDDLGNIVEYIDKKTNTTYNYTYDELGNLVKTQHGPWARENEYDNANRLRTVTQSYFEPMCKYSLEYDKNADGEILPENTISKITLEDVYEKTFEKDEYQRLEKETTKTSSNVTLSKEFTYLEQNNRLTTLVDSVKSKVGDTVTGNLKYTYDNNGNITVITDISGETPEVLCEYYYDGLNRLKRENNALRNRTYTYAYDKAGNITQKASHSFALGNNTSDIALPSDLFTYHYSTTGWKDKLIGIEDETGALQSITYDAVGNPLTYRGHTLEWTDVRRLKKFDNVSFAYNANGIRTEKGGNTFYDLDGDNILMETRYEMGSDGAPICHSFIYHYDQSGVSGFRYNGQTYYYVKNLQGDVIEIRRQDGTLVGEYNYDAWGRFTITYNQDNIAMLNPFRYRGYYYDTETGFYYLKTRYYDPTTGRFINADGLVSTGQDLDGFNMYAYCGNNPVTRHDPTGKRYVEHAGFSGGTTIVATVLISAIVVTGINHTINKVNESKIEDEVQESYTKEEAKEEIDEILSSYGENVTINFNDNRATINNSAKVNSRYDRQKVSMIISRTDDLTDRDYDNISAEWALHNVFYNCHIARGSTEDADLDYTADSRWYVVLGTNIFEFLGWE